MNSEVNIGVAFTVSERVSLASFKLVKQLKQIGIVPFLELSPENYPHITLFQARISSIQKESVHNIVEKIKNAFTLVSLVFERKLFFHPSSNNLFWNLVNTPELQKIHEEVVVKIMPLTEGRLMRQFKQMVDDPTTPELVRAHILTYGTELSGNQFLPHLTLVKLRPEDFRLVEFVEKNKEISIPLFQEEFVPTQMIVGEIDEWGRMVQGKEF